jgi:sigma-B regulation protein RsbU (phosphoserine phosphatase)
MELTTSSVIREQLVDRRDKLRSAVSATGERQELTQLLHEVDSALRRLDVGSYGRCEICQDPIEADRLLADPLVRFCLDHLSPDEQRSLEMDLELASRIQRGLLPPAELRIDGWEIGYHYQPARIVSGDYCDVIASADGSFHFMLGDVSGKGVAASMLMAHLHAMFRTLISLELPLMSLMERASRAFCESTLPTHYATLVCGRATRTGDIEVCNAGHLPIIISTAAGPTLLRSSALPIGMFCSEQFKVHRLQLARGETMALITDGITETENPTGDDFGIERFAGVVHGNRALPVRDLINASLNEVAIFAGLMRQSDDVTMLALRRT